MVPFSKICCIKRYDTTGHASAYVRVSHTRKVITATIQTLSLQPLSLSFSHVLAVLWAPHANILPTLDFLVISDKVQVLSNPPTHL